MEKINSWNWDDRDIVESTNDEAQQQSQISISEKFIISAKKQLSGRGRRGNTWQSLTGNLFFSQGLCFDAQKIGQLVCLSSLSLYQTFQDFIKEDIHIKWPNDILVNNKKISGMLLEKGAGDYFIIGIGVNIKSYPTDLNQNYQATSFLDNGINIDRLTFLRSYINKFDNNYELWQSQGFSKIKEQWLQFAKGIDDLIIVRTHQENIQGKFMGIGNNGELLLDVNQKIIPIYAGEIFYLDERKY